MKAESINKDKSITKLGFWSIVLLAINSIIGTGIFLSPGSVASMVGSYAPLIFLAAACFTIFLAITFASAAKYVNKSGASYAYAKAAFGLDVGFYVGVTRIVAASIAWGVMASAVVKSVYAIFGIESNFTTVTIGFLALMLILFIINVFGTRFITFVNDFSTIGKLLALFLTIIAGLVILFITRKNNIGAIDLFQNADGTKLVPNLTVTSIATAILAAFYAFTGFESVASGSDDMEEPEKNLPKAIPLAIIVIAVVYFGVVAITMMINPVVIVTSKEPVVLASVFKNPIIKYIIIIGAIISMFGINVAASFSTPRIFEAMSKEKQAPKFLSRRIKGGLPLPAFILTAVIAIIIPMAFHYNIGDIIIISSISRFVQFIVVPIGVIKFYYGRAKEPILIVKKNFITDVIIPIIALIFTIILLVKFNWVDKFSITTATGELQTNWYAVCSMVLGYVILPMVLVSFRSTIKENNLDI